MTPALLTTSQAAKLSGLSQSLICRLADDGVFKAFRIPGSKHRRIVRESFEKWLEQMMEGAKQ